MTYEEFKACWRARTVRQIEREIASWRKHFQKHDTAYAVHGGELTAPDELADGMKLMALREVLEEMQ